VFFCEDSFNKCPGFKHTILLATTFDGNNKIIILAYAIVDIEDSSNLVWFKENIEEDFPGCTV
jgi:hypothetical protein